MSLRKPTRALIALLGIIFVLGALLPAGAAAQEPPRFKRLEVSIWPEYDEPRLLVRQKGELADGVSLPASLRFPVPAGAEGHTACAIDETGKHLPRQWEITSGDNPVLAYAVDKRVTDNEFYLQSFEGAGRREFTYKVRLPGAVDSLLVEVQQPLRSTGFSVAPAAKQTLNDKEGFQYHRYDYSNLAAGQEITFTVSYEKADAKPSVNPQNSNAAAGPQVAATGNGGEMGLALMLFGGGVLAVGFFAYRGSGRRQPARAKLASGGQAKGPNRRPQAPAPARVAASRAVATSPARQGSRFCTQCGDGLPARAAFCPACGTQVR